MAVINNLQAYDAAIRATGCPIDGVDATGKIYFNVAATQAQIAAANAAAAAYADVAPQIVPIEVIFSRMTDAEYQAFFVRVASDVVVHRMVYQRRQIDVASPAAQTLVAALVTAGIFSSSQRATVAFAPLPPPAPPPAAAQIPPAQSIYNPPAAPPTLP